MTDFDTNSQPQQTSTHSTQLSHFERIRLMNVFCGNALILSNLCQEMVACRVVDMRQFETVVGNLSAKWNSQPMIVASFQAAEYLHNALEVIRANDQIFGRIPEARRKTIKNLFDYICKALPPDQRKRIKGVIQGGEIENDEKWRRSVKSGKPKSRTLRIESPGA